MQTAFMTTSREIGQRIKQARTVHFRRAVEAAESLGVKYATYAGHENGSRDAKGNIELYARRYGVSTDWLLTGRGAGPRVAVSGRVMSPPGKVRLAGRVGAGQVITPFDDEPYEWVEEPADAAADTVAVEVVGDSGFPAFDEGSLLYYSKLLPPSEMVNRKAVLRTARGEMYVKILRKGSSDGLWNLQSINSLYPDIEDAVVEWAAPIDWIKLR